eukprot:g4830.t1
MQEQLEARYGASPRHRETLQEDSYFKVRVQSCTNKGLIGILVVFSFGILCCSFIGKMSPEIFHASLHALEMPCSTYICNLVFRGYLNHLEKKHQSLYLEFAMNKPYKYGESYNVTVERELDYTQHFSLSAQAENVWAGKSESQFPRKPLLSDVERSRTIHCPAGTMTCDPITLFAVNVLDYSGYHVQVELQHPYEAAGYVDAFGRSTLKLREIARLRHIQELAVAKGTQVAPDVLAKLASLDTTFIPHEISGIFSLKYVNQAFTEYEFSVKYTFAIISMTVAVFYTMTLKNKLAPRFWSFEQKWVVILSWALIGFNDPFFLLEIEHPSLAAIGLSITATTSFLCLLLLFWLSIFDIIAQNTMVEQTRYLGFTFWAPKCALVGLLWFTVTMCYMILRAQEVDDPTYFAMNDLTHFGVTKTVIQVLLFFYVCWIGSLMLKTVYISITLTLPKMHFRFMFGLTVVAMITAVFGIAQGFFSAQVLHAREFVTYVGATNLYVWILCFAYYPDDEAMEQQLGDKQGDENQNNLEAATNVPGGSGIGRHDQEGAAKIVELANGVSLAQAANTDEK